MKPVGVNFHSIKQEIAALSLDAVSRLGLRLAFLAIGLQFILLAFFWQRLPPELPLLYSRPYGEAQLADNYWLWFLPGLNLVLELLTIRLAGRSPERPWNQILAWAGAVGSLMALTALAKIISLVI